MGAAIRVLLVDDHAVVRDSLQAMLKLDPDIQVIGLASNADEAIEKVLALNPDVMVMDIDMPGLICFDAASRINSLRPSTKIIFLSAFFNDLYIEQALAVQAKGYLTKSEPAAKVVQGIKMVAGGSLFFSDEVRSRLLVDGSGVKLAEKPQTRASSLTQRELEVLRYLARGLSKKEIANTMGVSVKTVDGHTAHLMTKLDIHDRVALTRFAIREGLAEA